MAKHLRQECNITIPSSFSNQIDEVLAMTNEKDIPRSEKGFAYYLGFTLMELERIFYIINPDKKEPDFANEYTLPMMSNKNTSGDLIATEFYKSPPDENRLGLKNATIQIAATYCIETLHAFENNDNRLASSLLMDARYWLGVSAAQIGIEKSRKITITATRKHSAEMGGKARFERKFKESKLLALKLVKQHCPPEGWRSVRSAALAVSNEVFEFAKQNNSPISENQIVKTISDWISDGKKASTDFSSYFEKK